MSDIEEQDSPTLSDLGGHIADYVSSAGQRLIGEATDKLTNLAGPESGVGPLAKAGARIVKGENPVTAFVSEKAGEVKDKVVGKAKEAVGLGGGSEAGDVKATNIIEHVDIGVPLTQVYNQWTQLEDFSRFTNGVSSVSVDGDDETKSDWKVRVWPSTRSWKATIVEQVPDERIIWTSEGSKGTTHGCVSFHQIDDRLTRVVVVVEYYPSGFFEKVGNIWRAQGRRLRLDLKHFQRYVTLQADTEEAEGRRAEIHDSEVVRSHDDVVAEEEEAEQREREEEEEEEGEDEEEGEEGEEEDEGEDEQDKEDEGKGKGRRKGQRSRK